MVEEATEAEAIEEVMPTNQATEDIDLIDLLMIDPELMNVIGINTVMMILNRLYRLVSSIPCSFSILYFG